MQRRAASRASYLRNTSHLTERTPQISAEHCTVGKTDIILQVFPSIVENCPWFVFKWFVGNWYSQMFRSLFFEWKEVLRTCCACTRLFPFAFHIFVILTIIVKRNPNSLFACFVLGEVKLKFKSHNITQFIMILCEKKDTLTFLKPIRRYKWMSSTFQITRIMEFTFLDSFWIFALF